MAHNVKQVTIAKIHFSSGALSMSLAVLLFLRAILQESEAKLEGKKINPPSILCGGRLSLGKNTPHLDRQMYRCHGNHFNLIF